MKKHILLPTDFSKNAWNAITYVLELYKNEECDFYLLNAFSIKTYDIDSIIIAKPGEVDYDMAFKESNKGLEKTFKMLQLHQTNVKHKFHTMTFFGAPLKAVIEAVEIKDIDLVVMGTKGETDAENIYYGSNAQDVMEKSRNCPVLMIPANASYSEPKEIVFPTSYKTHFKKRELNYLYEISKITNAVVRILHINKEDQLSEKQTENKRLLEDCFDGLEYSFHTLDNVDINTGLHNFVQSRSSDMVAFISKKHTFFDKLFKRTMVEDLGYSSRVPVLVMHDLRN